MCFAESVEWREVTKREAKSRNINKYTIKERGKGQGERGKGQDFARHAPLLNSKISPSITPMKDPHEKRP